MGTLTFYIVDVFAEQKYAGNQLAVIRNAQDLASDEMQRIAKEMGFSETTFILSDVPRDGGYDVRIFTPGAEVPFAGHPTLGTASIIRTEIIGKEVERVNLNLKVGQIPVTFGRTPDRDVVWMRQNAPDFGATVSPAEMAAVLGVQEKDIDDRFPMQEVSTGMWFIIVPLKTLEAVKQARIQRDKYLALIAQRQAKAILVCCRETYSPDNDMNVRVFVPYYGIEEDPATGSGNGTLAAYLVKHRYFGENRIDILVEQGYEIGRPSRLYLRAHDDGQRIHVEVGGRVFAIAKGTLL